MSRSAAGYQPDLFRRRFLGGELLVGSFIKFPTPHSVEVLGDVGFDFVVIDEEHGPFDRVTIDNAILAGRASGAAPIVRVSEPTASKLLSVLDDGAAGVLVPHVSSAAKAREIAAACRYRGGKRGFSNTTRAGGFGRHGMWSHVDLGDASATVIAMIEDPEALDEIDAIVATDGLDGFFIGRGDLTMAFGAANQDAEPVRDAVRRIIAAAAAVKKPVCVMIGAAADAAPFRQQGVNTFIVGSDQTFLRQAGQKVLTDFAALTPAAA